MATFSVLQDTNPGFGVIPSDGPYIAVASGSGDLSDLQICEMLFHATNSIDEPWYEIACERHLLNVIVAARSTSVGDIVRIEDADGVRYFKYEMVGMSPLSDAPQIVGGKVS